LWFLNRFKGGYKGFSDRGTWRQCIELELVKQTTSKTKSFQKIL